MSVDHRNRSVELQSEQKTVCKTKRIRIKQVCEYLDAHLVVDSLGQDAFVLGVGLFGRLRIVSHAMHALAFIFCQVATLESSRGGLKL